MSIRAVSAILHLAEPDQFAYIDSNILMGISYDMRKKPRLIERPRKYTKVVVYYAKMYKFMAGNLR